MRSMRLVVVFALVLVAGAAAGQQVKWEQLPMDGIALWSQLDECVENWTAEAADDFLCEDGSEITWVEWWGFDVPDECTEGTSFLIRFYNDVPDPDPSDPSTWSHPGDLLYEDECLYYTKVWEEEVQQYHYYQELPQSFLQVAGSIYWISIQARVCYPDCGWGWCECDDAEWWNDEAVWRSQHLGDPNAPEWDVPEWTPVSVFTGGAPPYDHAELSFRPLSGSASPIQESSWGNVKALFR